MHLTILGSSSSGNSALVEVGGKRLLIDAGFSFRKLTQMLQTQSACDIATIDAVLVTHEHSDHTSGLSGFAKLGTPVYMTAGTFAALPSKLAAALNVKKIPQQAVFTIGEVSVESFSVPHDAIEPVGFVLRYQLPTNQNPSQLTWALDMGYLTDQVRAHLQQSHIIVLESNYDDDLLKNSRRPFSLKQRIKGRHGHLSNSEAFEFISQNHTNCSWQQVYLAHLSNDCNDVSALQSRYNIAGINVEVVNPKLVMA